MTDLEPILNKGIDELIAGDEIYRVRFGANKTSYRKIKILDIVDVKRNGSTAKRYKFIIKGGVGKPQFITTRLNIVAFKSRYFKDYSSLMKSFINDNYNLHGRYSKALKDDIKHFKRKFPEYLI